MVDDRNLFLQTLFAEANEELEGESFTLKVMAQSRKQRYQTMVSWFSLAAMMLTSAVLLAAPLQEFAQLLTFVFTRTLVDLGGGWLTWLLSPVNNIGSLVIVGGRALRVGWKKIRRASYVN